METQLKKIASEQQQLKDMGVRLAEYGEPGWYVSLVADKDDGTRYVYKVWATDLPE